MAKREPFRQPLISPNRGMRKSFARRYQPRRACGYTQATERLPGCEPSQGSLLFNSAALGSILCASLGAVLSFSRSHEDHSATCVERS
jgi:hypothetical protein